MSYTSYFEDELLPTALLVGCSPHEFWFESPKLLWSYVKAYQEKKKQDWAEWREKIDVASWLQGCYVRRAIDSLFSKNREYPRSPLGAFKTSEKNSLSAEEQVSETERAIRERSAKIDKMLAEKNLKPGLYLGEKRR